MNLDELIDYLVGLRREIPGDTEVELACPTGMSAVFEKLQPHHLEIDQDDQDEETSILFIDGSPLCDELP